MEPIRKLLSKRKSFMAKMVLFRTSHSNKMRYNGEHIAKIRAVHFNGDWSPISSGAESSGVRINWEHYGKVLNAKLNG